jgi:hypothetical protein
MDPNSRFPSSSTSSQWTPSIPAAIDFFREMMNSSSDSNFLKFSSVCRCSGTSMGMRRLAAAEYSSLFVSVLFEGKKESLPSTDKPLRCCICPFPEDEEVLFPAVILVSPEAAAALLLAAFLALKGFCRGVLFADVRLARALPGAMHWQAYVFSVHPSVFPHSVAEHVFVASSHVSNWPHFSPPSPPHRHGPPLVFCSEPEQSGARAQRAEEATFVSQKLFSVTFT